jgi:predicted DNA-binding antitoxin AbrB/MazE fold protein
MAAQKSWAVYHDGQLRLLEPLDLAEGERVQVMVTDARAAIRAALADLLKQWDDDLGPLPLLPNGDLDEEALLRELHEATRGLPPLSEEMIEERRNGP